MRESRAEGETWLCVTERVKLEHLVHGHICHPKLSLVVHRQAVGQVEERATPGVVRFPCGGRELEKNWNLDGAILNVLVLVGVIKRSAKLETNTSITSLKMKTVYFGDGYFIISCEVEIQRRGRGGGGGGGGGVEGLYGWSLSVFFKANTV